jgi:hypothetical protein
MNQKPRTTARPKASRRMRLAPRLGVTGVVATTALPAALEPKIPRLVGD